VSPEDGYFIYVQGKPKTKDRPRVTKNGTFTPKATLDYEQCVRDTWEQAGHPTLDGPLGVRIIYSKDGAAIWVYELDEAEEKIEKITKSLLANTVIEEYSIEIS